MKLLVTLFTLVAAASGNSLDDITSSSCGRDSEFSASILIEHEVADPEWIDDTELAYLAKAFVSVYNGLNTPNEKDVVCDSEFLRYAVSAEIEPKDVFFNDNQGRDGRRRARRNFLYTLKLTGVGVSDRTPVFDDGTPRWELLTEETTDSNQNPQPCKCSAKAESRAPTYQEFQGGFNTFIQNLETFGKLNNIHTVHYVTGLQDVSCDKSEKAFELDVVIDLEESSTGTVDLAKMGNNFKDSYNELVNSYCDPCFRTIESVTIMASKKGLKGAKVDERLKATVKGQSRCPDTASLFDNSHRRLQPASFENTVVHGRRLVDSNSCYCPANPIASHAPTTVEFLQAFSKISSLTNSAKVAEINEP